MNIVTVSDGYVNVARKNVLNEIAKSRLFPIHLDDFINVYTREGGPRSEDTDPIEVVKLQMRETG